MAHKPIVNIINFIRAIEPRRPERDLVEPVVKQAELLRKHGLKGTWLLQYDAMQMPVFTDLCRELAAEGHEIGGWFEIVQPLAEAVDLPWRGRYPWDWHAHCSFSVGYTPQERERLTDEFVDLFEEEFGFTPRSIGSWMIDAHTLAYMHDKHGVIASCNCKDQWGTDGYTMWGGYWNQAYYPSRKNAYIPAQSSENQIPIPVFRMLGSDPIYQYSGVIRDVNAQEVVSLEPIQTGDNPDWVNWFFKQMFEYPSLSFGYAQVGQENSFGWPNMEKGYKLQMAFLEQAQERGGCRVETLAESGEWYRSTYPHTPASAVTALDDWKEQGRSSIWYQSRFYRSNIFQENDAFGIRDLYLYDDRYEERYLTEQCEGETFHYDALPVVDGSNTNNFRVPAELTPCAIDPSGSYQPFRAQGKPVVRETSQDSLELHWGLEGGLAFCLRCLPDRISAQCKHPAWGLVMKEGSSGTSHICNEQTLSCTHRSFGYGLTLERGTGRTDAPFLQADDGELTMLLSQ